MNHINHVLSSTPIYTLSTYSIPKYILLKLESHFLAFHWGSFEGKAKKKLKSWKSLALLKSEGRLCLKSLVKVMEALRMKLAWNFLHQTLYGSPSFRTNISNLAP